jgi:NitT/TauT family transport system permease protein
MTRSLGKEATCTHTAGGSLDSGGEAQIELHSRRRSVSRWRSYLVATGWWVAALAIVIAIWQLVIVVTHTPDYELPPVTKVLSVLWTSRGVLWSNTLVTLTELVVAFVVSSLLGVVIAMAIAFSKIVERLFYPILVVSQAVPKVAVGPLFLLWFGFGFKTNVFIAISVAIFPVIVNTSLGLLSIDPEFIQLGRSMGATPVRLFLKMRLPNALPSTFAGLKISITLALIGVVVGEFVASSSGLGYLTLAAGGNQDAPLVFAALIFLAIVGGATYAVVETTERILLRWHPSQQNRESRSNG